jgi:hypothetical protein
MRFIGINSKWRLKRFSESWRLKVDRSFIVIVFNIRSEYDKLILYEIFPWKYTEYHPALPNFNNRSGSIISLGFDIYIGLFRIREYISILENIKIDGNWYYPDSGRFDTLKDESFHNVGWKFIIYEVISIKMIIILGISPIPAER